LVFALKLAEALRRYRVFFPDEKMNSPEAWKTYRDDCVAGSRVAKEQCTRWFKTGPMITIKGKSSEWHSFHWILDQVRYDN